MRDWNLKPGDPLSLTLAADARLGDVVYPNDHIWELELGGGDPAALSLRTTYGLRARNMRLFPRFIVGGKAIADPAAFANPPIVRRFYPNYLVVVFEPLPGLEVTAEYWIPASQVAAGRLTIVNRSVNPHAFTLEWVGQLTPMEGGSFAPAQIQSVNVLAGRTSGLEPVIFLTGGPEPGPGPYPSLNLHIDLSPGLSRQVTWAQAALNNHKDSFDLARRTAARPWDQELARIELFNASEMVHINTGDPNWDAALAFSQVGAFRLLMNGEGLPHLGLVLARQPDQGYSQRGDGSDYSYFWSGFSPLDAAYLAATLPGAAKIVRGLVRNFLYTQTSDGEIDCKPGLAGQRSRVMATPLLVSLVWDLYQSSHDLDFLREVYPALKRFFDAWFSEAHDRDRNGIPEWSHPMQPGFEDNPLFDHWHAWAQGLSIDVVESPALASMLYREARCLVKMQEALGETTHSLPTKVRAGVLRAGIEASWDETRAIYRYRDRDTHLCLPGRLISERNAAPLIEVNKTFKEPVRIVIRTCNEGPITRPHITIRGKRNGSDVVETLTRDAFQIGANGAVAVSQSVFDALGQFEVEGLTRKDKIIIRSVDLTGEDYTLLLPLWAGVPDARIAEKLVRNALLNALRFDRPYGAPAMSDCPDKEAENMCLRVHLPWNALILRGLLNYGYRHEAARLMAHLMSGIIHNLSRSRAFYRFYHAETGAGMGERNALSGLAPVGLFLETLGVRIISSNAVHIQGENPFPWPVTVKYRGLKVSRQVGHTEVSFPSGKTVTLQDPTEALITAE